MFSTSFEPETVNELGDGGFFGSTFLMVFQKHRFSAHTYFYQKQELGVSCKCSIFDVPLRLMKFISVYLIRPLPTTKSLRWFYCIVYDAKLPYQGKVPYPGIFFVSWEISVSWISIKQLTRFNTRPNISWKISISQKFYISLKISLTCHIFVPCQSFKTQV